MVHVRVPATTANLGAGFDCLGMALTLYNEVEAEEADGLRIEIRGEGVHDLPLDETNLVWRAAQLVFKEVGRWPRGAHLRLTNHIPLESGLGSSAAAVVAGLLVGNALLGRPLMDEKILHLAVEMEGHPDNVAPAMLGGLVAAGRGQQGQLLVTQPATPSWQAVVVLPNFRLSTRVARQALPASVPYDDAVFNLGRLALTLVALGCGDYALLAQAMGDRLHHPYRAPLVPGLAAALEAVQSLNLAGAISGAGPAIIAFTDADQTVVIEAIQAAFTAVGCTTRSWSLETAAGAVCQVT